MIIASDVLPKKLIFLVSPVHTACSAHLILLELIILGMFDEEYKCEAPPYPSEAPEKERSGSV
jgi:hypothetical protein